MLSGGAYFFWFSEGSKLSGSSVYVFCTKGPREVCFVTAGTEPCESGSAARTTEIRLGLWSRRGYH